MYCNFVFPKSKEICIVHIDTSCNITNNTKRINQIHKNQICTNNLYLHILETFMNFHPLLLRYNYLKLVLSYQNLSLLIFQENFREEPPCLLLHYYEYNHLLKWWLNLQCCLLPPKLKPLRPKIIPGSHMILIHAWCEISIIKFH